MEKKSAIRPLHVGLSVADLEESIAWYHEMLGFEYQKTVEVEPIRCHIAVMELPGTEFALELFHHWDSVPAPAESHHPDTDVRTQGAKHLCLYVEGLTKKIEELRAKGVPVVVGPGTFEPYTFYYIRDPSGILIELQEII